MMDTQDIEFENTRVRLYRAGQGPRLLLIHGIGPGTSIPANFGTVIPALAEHYSVVGMDLIGFGGSERKSTAPFFDFPLWCRQARFVADTLGADELRIWGQSLGGAMALQVASEMPSVTRVITTGTGGGKQTLNPALERFWTFPPSAEALREALLSSMYDTSGITDEVVRERFETLQQGGIGDYFSAMMAGDKQALLDSVYLSPKVLNNVQARVLLLHGRDDVPVPYRDTTLHLLDHLPTAEAVILSRCGHNPAREHTDRTLSLALEHLR
ncbi:alpha/beta fold hydrolase [Alloalcanivorax sp. C16-2]|uniref:alpha/beta fold hydrolase n=1 Tax=Alloalcanivorax TaxID=3020832 RepID=UPI0019334D2A|nr:alpha/beta hydrolase [Alloalcanivorax marinus]MBL7252435.1 alpha/beta fold hydrolase [Alloalcanivorax marinus]